VPGDRHVLDEEQDRGAHGRDSLPRNSGREDRVHVARRHRDREAEEAARFSRIARAPEGGLVDAGAAALGREGLVALDAEDGHEGPAEEGGGLDSSRSVPLVKTGTRMPRRAVQALEEAAPEQGLASGDDYHADAEVDGLLEEFHEAVVGELGAAPAAAIRWSSGRKPWRSSPRSRGCSAA
jgi:hypothetical protein